MRGTVTGLQRALSGMFFIDGDDGTTYFSHVRKCKDKSNTKQFLYNGNKCTFDIRDEGKNHLSAEDVIFDEVEDPDAERKRENRIQHREQKRQAEIRRQEAYVRKLEQQVRYYQKKDFDSRTKYVVQVHIDGEWTNYYLATGKIAVFNDPHTALDYVSEHKDGETQMRVRKARVCVIGGKTVVREV